MRKLILSSVMLLAVGTYTASAQQAAIALQKGQKYTVESKTKMSSSAEVMGQTMESGSESKSTVLYEVAAITDNSADLTTTITKLQVSASAMGQEMNYDSEKNDNSGQLADALQGSINTPRKIVIDTKGNITKQDEPDAAVQGALGGINGAGAPPKTTDLFIPALMGKDLKVGDKIDDEGTSKSEKSETKEKGTFTVTAIENGVASISYTGTQQINATIEQMGMEMTTTSSNTVKSELQLDIKTGIVLAKATVIDASISVDAGGMTIPATAKTTTTVTIVPAK